VNDFRVIFKILRYLHDAMDVEEPDFEPIQAAALDVSPARWLALIEMMVGEGYVTGVTIRRYIHEKQPRIVDFNPRITLKGLEYFSENSVMKRMLNPQAPESAQAPKHSSAHSRAYWGGPLALPDGRSAITVCYYNDDEYGPNDLVHSCLWGCQKHNTKNREGANAEAILPRGQSVAPDAERNDRP
jgi:hypothetical protein